MIDFVIVGKHPRHVFLFASKLYQNRVQRIHCTESVLGRKEKENKKG